MNDGDIDVIVYGEWCYCVRWMMMILLCMMNDGDIAEWCDVTVYDEWWWYWCYCVWWMMLLCMMNDGDINVYDVMLLCMMVLVILMCMMVMLLCMMNDGDIDV